MRWFDVRSVSIILGVSINTVGGYIRGGKLRHKTIKTKGGFTGTQHLIPETAIVEFLETHWGVDKERNPKAKGIDLEHLLEYGVKAGTIKSARTLPLPGDPDKPTRNDRHPNKLRNLRGKPRKKQFELAGIRHEVYPPREWEEAERIWREREPKKQAEKARLDAMHKAWEEGVRGTDYYAKKGRRDRKRAAEKLTRAGADRPGAG